MPEAATATTSRTPARTTRNIPILPRKENSTGNFRFQSYRRAESKSTGWRAHTAHRELSKPDVRKASARLMVASVGRSESRLSAGRPPHSWGSLEFSPHPFRPDLRPKCVDEHERALAFHVPEGPAVAGFQPLRKRADAMDRANGIAKRDGAVGAHQRLVAALGIEQVRARRDHAALDQRRERHARRFAGRRKRRKRSFGQRLDSGDAALGRLPVGLVALDADEAPAKAFCHGAGRARAAERVEHKVAGARRGQNHAGKQRFRLLCRVKLLVVVALEALFARTQ